MSSSSDQNPVKLCTQRRHNGDPCPSPALPDRNVCHHHRNGPDPIDIENGAPPFPSRHVYLPSLKDAASIQLAISEVCEMMLHRRIEPKEAGALFYAMQVASTNLGHLNGANGLNKRQKKNQEKRTEPPSAASSEAVSTANDDSASVSPDPLPPGTIQACEQPRRFAVENRL